MNSHLTLIKHFKVLCQCIGSCHGNSKNSTILSSLLFGTTWNHKLQSGCRGKYIFYTSCSRFGVKRIIINTNLSPTIEFNYFFNLDAVVPLKFFFFTSLELNAHVHQRNEYQGCIKEMKQVDQNYNYENKGEQ